MYVMLDADRYHADFDGTEISSTGSLVEDIADLCAWFDGARQEIADDQLGIFLSEADPMEDLRAVASLLALHYPELRQMGFLPPDRDYATGPIEFVSENAAFLASIYLLVREPERTVH